MPDNKTPAPRGLVKDASKGFSRSFWEAITGNPRQRPLRDQLKQMFGKNARGGPDTAAAAAELGVSPRTVQRWLQKGAVPKSPRGQQYTQTRQAWEGSAAGRQRRRTTADEKKLRTSGGVIAFRGNVQVSKDRYFRTVNISVDTAEAAGVLDALRAGDDAEAHRILEDAFGQACGGSVSLTDGAGYYLGGN